MYVCMYVCLRTYVRIYAHTKSCTRLRNMIDDLEGCFCEVNVSSVVMLYNVVDRLCAEKWFAWTATRADYAPSLPPRRN